MDVLFLRGDPWLVAFQRPFVRLLYLHMPLQENVQPFHILPEQGHITESGEGEESKRLRLPSYESELLDV